MIPGAVEPDLWNEHVSRYYFAREFAHHRRLLDIGCGVGYGTDLLAAAARQSLGIDISPETIDYAIHHAQNGAQFCVASAESLPLPHSSFDLVTAFEVIEHLSGWRDLLRETARVLTQDGVFLVSTPNKAYYAETRQNVGPNPFHVHEFELSEFQSALQAAFPHVVLFAQNHGDVMAFAGENSAGPLKGYLLSSTNLTHSHFFLAVCSKEPMEVPAFLYAGASGNLLRERETYIHLLKQEVDSFTKELTAARGELHSTKEELSSTSRELTTTRKELTSLRNELLRLQNELLRLQKELPRLRNQVEILQGEKRAAAQSKWLRLGRKLGLGPNLQERL